MTTTTTTTTTAGVPVEVVAYVAGVATTWERPAPGVTAPLDCAQVRETLMSALADTGYRIVPDPAVLEPRRVEELAAWFVDQITRDPVLLNAPRLRGWMTGMAADPLCHPALGRRYGSPENPLATWGTHG